MTAGHAARMMLAGLAAVLVAVVVSPALCQAGRPKITALRLLDAAIAEGRIGDAEEIIRRAPIEALDPEFRLRQAEVALAAGRMAEAITGFGLLTEERVAAARAQQGLGIARLRRGQPLEAAAALDVALKLDSGLLRAQRARGAAADRLRDWPRAETAYARALALAPGDAATLSNRGWSRLLCGQYAQAEADLRAVQTADPNSKVVAGNRRLARAMQGRYEEAFTGSTRESLAADLNSVGFAAMARGDLEIAEAYFKRAMTLSPRFDKMADANLKWVEAVRARKTIPR